MKVKVSHIWLFVTPWTVACQGFSVHGILQARIVEWVPFPFSRGSSLPRDQTQVSRVGGGFFTSWGTKEALLKAIRHRKSNPKREVYNNSGLSKERRKISNKTNMPCRELAKRTKKFKVSRRKKIIKIREEINKIETKLWRFPPKI